MQVPVCGWVAGCTQDVCESCARERTAIGSEMHHSCLCACVCHLEGFCEPLWGWLGRPTRLPSSLWALHGHPRLALGVNITSQMTRGFPAPPTADPEAASSWEGLLPIGYGGLVTKGGDQGGSTGVEGASPHLCTPQQSAPVARSGTCA